MDNVQPAVTTVKLIFPEGKEILGYWKFGPTPGDTGDHWYEFPIDEIPGVFIDNNKVTLRFVDGQPGDDDLTENGQITDVGAPLFTPADLSLAMTDFPDPAVVGAALAYTLVVTNNGPSDATGVILTDMLPDNVTFQTATPSQGEACSQVSGTVTCRVGNMNSSDIATVTITITPTEGATGPTGGTEIINTASVAATEDDDKPNNNTAFQETVVYREADTSVTGAGSTQVLVEQPLTYNLVVTNHGPSQAINVVMTDTLPANVTSNRW